MLLGLKKYFCSHFFFMRHTFTVLSALPETINSLLELIFAQFTALECGLSFVLMANFLPSWKHHTSILKLLFPASKKWLFGQRSTLHTEEESDWKVLIGSVTITASWVFWSVVEVVLLVIFQTLIKLSSQPAETRNEESAVKTIDLTSPLCPVKVRIFLFV